MKKLFAILLAVTMMATMSVSAFAAETIDKDGGTSDITVNATYQDNATTIHKISVNVSWEAMEFTYSASGTKTWDEKEHTYTNNITAGWSEGKTVTVTNHSDSAVKVDFTFAADDAYKSVKGNFDKASVNLPSAVGKDKNAADLTDTTKLTLSGTLSSSVTTSTKVGTITVKITKIN